MGFPETGNVEDTYSAAVLQTADMNGDSKPDLIVAVESAFIPNSGIFVLLNTTKAGPNLGLMIPSGGSSTQTVQAGGTATYTLSIGGMGWSGQGSLSCTGAPTGATCSFPSGSNMNINGGKATQFNVTVTTSAPTEASAVPRDPLQGPWLWGMLAAGLLMLPKSSKRSRSGRKSFGILMSLALLLFVCSCGGGSGGGSTGTTGATPTPSGNYTLTVTATSGSVKASLPLTLVVE